MKDKLQNLIRIFVSKQFLMFLLVGGLNTVNGMLFPTVLSNFMQANVAYILSYLPSLGISYVLNSFFTFHEKKLSLRRCVKFYISYLPNFLIQNVVFVIAYNVFHANKYIGILLASALGIPVTFLLMKFFAFGQKEENRK